MILDYVALGVIAFLLILGAVAVVQLGALPGKIAHRRGHPQADAVNAASWISFVTLGALWPLAFVWAFFNGNESSAETPTNRQQKMNPQSDESLSKEVENLRSRLTELEDAVKKLQPQS
jgi:hypothetical protein